VGLLGVTRPFLSATGHAGRIGRSGRASGVDGVVVTLALGLGGGLPAEDGIRVAAASI
jgi:hypothetical protein